ncbi:MAG TPA: hypothetical protein VNM39_05290, partial [Verrucomicrobiae bacterium]|nr:hypothetical protein [Verrucomicrobiae bacterium]
MLTTRAKGTFIWYELATTDGKAAEKFYASVLGWKSKDMSGPGGTYTIVSAGPADVGGIWTMPREMAPAGTGATWLPYIGLDALREPVHVVHADVGEPRGPGPGGGHLARHGPDAAHVRGPRGDDRVRATGSAHVLRLPAQHARVELLRRLAVGGR